MPILCAAGYTYHHQRHAGGNAYGDPYGGNGSGDGADHYRISFRAEVFRRRYDTWFGKRLKLQFYYL